MPSPESFHECHPGTPGLRDQLSSNLGGAPEARAACSHPGWASASTNVPTAPQPSGHPDMDEFTVPGLATAKDFSPAPVGLEAAGRVQVSWNRLPLALPGTPPQADSRSCSIFLSLLPVVCRPSPSYDRLLPKTALFPEAHLIPHPGSSLVPPAINHASPSQEAACSPQGSTLRAGWLRALPQGWTG